MPSVRVGWKASHTPERERETQKRLVDGGCVSEAVREGVTLNTLQRHLCAKCLASNVRQAGRDKEEVAAYSIVKHRNDKMG